MVYIVSAGTPWWQANDDHWHGQRQSGSHRSSYGAWSAGPPTGDRGCIDTGFSGFLTLPPRLVTTLGLAWLCRQPGILADGRVEYFDVYVATVIWDGQPRTVEVEAADTEPLVGMSLLEHHALQIDVLNGGSVTITALL